MCYGLASPLLTDVTCKKQVQVTPKQSASNCCALKLHSGQKQRKAVAVLQTSHHYVLFPFTDQLDLPCIKP